MESVYSPEDNQHRIPCSVCDKLCIDEFYPNHLKSQIH